MKWLVLVVWLLAVVALAQTLGFGAEAAASPLGAQANLDQTLAGRLNDSQGPNESPLAGLALESVDGSAVESPTDKIKIVLRRYVSNNEQAYTEAEPQFQLPQFDESEMLLLDPKAEANLDPFSRLTPNEQNTIRQLVESAFVSEVGNQATQAWRASQMRRPIGGPKSIRTLQPINMRLPPRFGKRACNSPRRCVFLIPGRSGRLGVDHAGSAWRRPSSPRGKSGGWALAGAAATGYRRADERFL